MVFGASCEVKGGAVTAIIGANGAGKSTLLRVITGVEKVASGSLEFGGHDIKRWAPWRRVRAGIVHVPEGRRVFATMTVLENLEVGATVAGLRVTQTALEGVFDAFPRLRERQHQPAGTMSGGEQQMLAIGRALMARPQVLLVDEPSLGLAPVAIAGVGETLRNLKDEGSLGILLAEQNVQLALTLADHTHVMTRGVLADAPKDMVEGGEHSADVVFGLTGGGTVQEADDAQGE